MKYIFQLGHVPSISLAEIDAILNKEKISYQKLKEQNDMVLLEIEDRAAIFDLMNLLGGTVKISREISMSKIGVVDVGKYLVGKSRGKKIVFSLNNFDKNFAVLVKKYLKQQSVSSRFVEPKNTATIIHNNLIESKSDLTLFNKQIFATIAVQPIEDFSMRDYGRPKSDARSGMLPPKLARVMLNLSGASEEEIILDPFCGSGTIIMEAYLLGFKKIVGSDISKGAVNIARENFDWIRKIEGETTKMVNLKNETKFLVSDVMKLAFELNPGSVGTIVTETYLGKPLSGRENRNFLLNQADELWKLYKEAFKVFHKILKKEGTIVIALPKFRYQNEWLENNYLKYILEIGFTIKPFLGHQSLFYFRPQQFVGREIIRVVK